MPTHTPLPAQFGRYHILEKVGEGGMGAVYRAEDTQLGRRVALKVPRFTATENPKVIERFYREARVAASIEHPNLCSVFDVGQIDGVHYLTMPFIEGTSLADRIDPDQPWPPRQAAELVRQLAAALGVLHQRGLIHRDLKPANILLRASGEPVIMDFGLARSFAEDSHRLTATGVAVGTPAYMSPEQIAGARGQIGPASDVYSLGVLLFELLTGSVPFMGPLAAVYGQILHGTAPAPSTLRPEVGKAVDRLCLKALAKKPEDRYASMAAFAAALQDFLGTEEVRPLPPPLPTGTAGSTGLVVRTCPVCGQTLGVPPVMQGRRVKCPGCQTILNVPGPGGAITRQPNPRAGRGEELAPLEEKPAAQTAIQGRGAVVKKTGAAPAPDWDFGGEGEVPVRQRGTAVSLWAWAAGGVLAATLVAGGILLATRKGPEKAPEVAQNDPTPKASRPKKPAPKAVVPPPDRPPQVVPGEREADKPPREPADPAPVVDVRPRPDPVVAPPPAAGGASPLDRLNQEKIPAADRLAGVKELVAVLLGSTEGGRSVTLSPDGKLLAAGFPDGSVHLWKFGGKEPRERPVLFESKKPIQRLAFTPDSKTLVFGSNGELQFWDRTGPNLQLRHRMPGGDYIAVSADGRTMAHAQGNAIRLVDLSGDAPRDKGFALRQPEGEILWLGFFPGGHALASAGRDGSVRLWDLTRTPPAPMRTIIDIPRVPILGLAVSPDGKALVKGTEKGTLELRDIGSDFQSKVRFRRTAHENGITSISFAPNGRTFITTGGGAGAARSQLIWWNTADGSKRAEWTLPAPCSAGAFAADGRHVALTCDNGNVYILRLAPAPAEKAPLVAGGPLRVIPHTGPVWAVCAVDKAGHQFISADSLGAHLWDANTGAEVRRFRGHIQAITAIAVSRDGHRLLTASLDRTVRLWDIATGKELQRLEHPSPVQGVAFSHDGRYILSGSGESRIIDAKVVWKDARVRLWDLASGKEVARFEDLGKPAVHLLFSVDDGRILADAGSPPVMVWDVASKKIIRRLNLPVGGFCCGFQPDGKRVFWSAPDNSLQVLDVNTGEQVRSLAVGSKPFIAVAVSRDGRRCITGGREIKVEGGRAVLVDGRVRLWDLESGRELAHHAEHTAMVNCVAISPDGSRVFSGSWDKTVRVWDLPATKGRGKP